MPNREEREHCTGKASPIESGGQQFYLFSFSNLLYSYVSSFIQTIKPSVEDQLMSNVLKTNISFTKVKFHKAVFWNYDSSSD